MDYIIAHKVLGQHDNQSDEPLVRITERQPEAFGVLYRRPITLIYRYIVARVGHESDSQDGPGVNRFMIANIDELSLGLD